MKCKKWKLVSEEYSGNTLEETHKMTVEEGTLYRVILTNENLRSPEPSIALTFVPRLQRKGKNESQTSKMD